jgi:hypothetical protein
VGRVRLQAGVTNPGHAAVLLEPAGDVEGILTVTFHPQVQRLQAVDEGVGVEGAQCRPEVAQRFHAGLQNE